jgi:YVTN family beta-propeller protein
MPNAHRRLLTLCCAVMGSLAAHAQTVTATLMAGTNPISVAVNPVTNKIYVANYRGASVTVIDGATNSTTTVGAGSFPLALAVNPVTNKIYVANNSSNNVTVIDGATNSTTTVNVGSSPNSVAVNPVTNKIYVANNGSGNVTVIDGAANSTANVNAGANPAAVALNPVTNKIYVVNNGSGNVTVIDGATNSTTTVNTEAAPISVAVNPVTNKIYVANGGSGNVTVIDGATNSTTTVNAPASRSVAVNPVTNKIYVANNNPGGSVTVIDGSTNSTTNVSAGAGPISVAVNPVTNEIYVANGGGGNVTVIDGATNSPTTINIGAGTQPQSVAVNPVTNKIYVANLNSANVTVIDGATNSTATVSAGGFPQSVAVNPVTNKIYVANKGSANVTVIDGATNSATNVNAGSSPQAVAVNPVTNKIYVANLSSDNVTVIDGVTNSTTTVSAGSGPASVAVNPLTNRIYVANSSGNTVTVIDGSSNSTATVGAGSEPGSVALNPVTNKIYVANVISNNVTVIDGATNSPSTVNAGTSPVWVAVNPVTNRIYVANEDSNNVTAIDGATNSTTTVNAGTHPRSVAVNSVTNKIYVANVDSNNVTVIDGATNSTTTVTAGFGPFSVAVNPVTNKIYLANQRGDNVTVIDGPTNSTTTVNAGSNLFSVAVNPVTNEIYVANDSTNNVTVITEQQVQAVPLTTVITPLAGNQTTSSTPSFTFTAQSNFSPNKPAPANVFFQMDTWQGPWTAATGSGPSFTGTAAALQPGFHILYAYAGDGQEADSEQRGSPLIGSIAAYGFLVNPLVLNIVKSHSGNFVQGQQNATYTVTVSNAGSIPASGMVTVTDTIPAGLTFVSMTGAGWNCSSNSCNRSDALAAGASYQQITVTVNVAANAGSPLLNQVSVSGGGFATASASDSTIVNIFQPTLSVNRKILNFQTSGSLVTSPQTVLVTISGGSNAPWTASSDHSNITVNPGSGAGTGTFQISAGAGSSGIVTVTSTGAINSPQTITVNVTAVTPAVPFGSFDTPLDNTTGVVGAIPVTGWALDSIEVTHVDILREPVTGEPAGNLIFIGTTVFSADARPDVQAMFPAYPFSYRAGWGYQMLTNFLPNSSGSGASGNGTYKLHAIAFNKSGSQLDLGTKTIVVDNAHAAKPFGTIDTPGQGGTISGADSVNFGWALTPQPANIPMDGSTITVVIDSVPVGHPTYNQFRSDIASLFPGYANSMGAVGFFHINTTTLANGVHTISWNVFDNLGRGEGLGSRYFNVLNAGGGGVAAPEDVIPTTAVRLRHGLNVSREPDPVVPDADGGYTVTMEEVGHIELHLGAFSGSMLVQGESHPLPIGSTLKGGVFYWQPGPGFLGEYTLQFKRPDETTIPVRINIVPKHY